MSELETTIRYVLLAAAACFVLGLHLMNSPATARRGNTLSAGAMTVAIVAKAVLLAEDSAITTTGWIVLLCGVLVGSAAGLWAARTVQMTAMPQLVSLFNAVGGGAAALLAIAPVLLDRGGRPLTWSLAGLVLAVLAAGLGSSAD